MLINATRVRKRAIAIFEGSDGFLFFLSGVLLIFIMLSVNFDVFLRWAFDKPQIWVIEIAEYMMVYLCFLGTMWVLKDDKHIKMDLVLNMLKPRAQYLINSITYFLGAVIFLILTWYGAVVTQYLFASGRYAPSILELLEWPAFVVIPLGSFLLFIQFSRMAYNFFRDFRKPPLKRERVMEKVSI